MSDQDVDVHIMLVKENLTSNNFVLQSIFRFLLGPSTQTLPNTQIHM